MTLSLPIHSLLRQHDGPLTRELAQAAAGHGLGRLPLRSRPDTVTTSICGFCSTGCALDIHVRDGQAIGLTPSAEYPVNTGMACPKGWQALDVLAASDRATTPMLRNTSGRLAAVDWHTAMTAFVERFRAIQQQYGPESVAWLGTGQIVTEELALLGALAKFGMGVLHGDGNTRQCMASAVVAYKQSFGFDAPPYTYADLEQSDVIVLVGSNLCIAHPILWQKILRNPHHPQIVVIDPRRTETANAATLHLTLRPKSDLVLLYGLARLLIERGWIRREFIDAHTSGFDEFAAHVTDYTPERVADQSGIDQATLERLAEIIHRGPRVSFWWTMGINQSHEGVRAAQAIINLALMTGNIGRPGTGANSITGQSNAMGSRLFSNTTGLLGAREFTSVDDRAEVAGILGIDVNRIPATNSQPYHQIVDGIASGRIKGLWIIGTNPSHSWIGQNDFRRMLPKLEWLVVQDMYSTTETAAAAHLLLPAAGWGEKEGSFINSERRIGLVKKVARAPGQALSDFAIFRLIAEYWGCGEMFCDWTSPEAVFQILKRLSRGRPCDFSGIEGYEMLDACGGVQWPYSIEAAREAPPAQERRLFEDHRFHHADGRALFIFDAPRPTPERITSEYPFVLLTGRASTVQWHTQSRTGKSAVLRKLSSRDLYVEINPQDGQDLGLKPDEVISVASRRGEIRARAFFTPCISRGQLFVPMHYAATNRLTDPVFDPHSKQPAYKACAVRIRRIEHWEA